MSAINLLLACLGGGITVMVAVGMVFLTPRGLEPREETPSEQTRRRDETDGVLDPEVVPHA